MSLRPNGGRSVGRCGIGEGRRGRRLGGRVRLSRLLRGLRWVVESFSLSDLAFLPSGYYVGSCFDTSVSVSPGPQSRFSDPTLLSKCLQQSSPSLVLLPLALLPGQDCGRGTDLEANGTDNPDPADRSPTPSTHIRRRFRHLPRPLPSILLKRQTTQSTPQSPREPRTGTSPPGTTQRQACFSARGEA